MKNITTPRTERDCVFWYGGDPIERPEPRHHVSLWKWGVWALFAFLALVLIAGRA